MEKSDIFEYRDYGRSDVYRSLYEQQSLWLKKTNERSHINMAIKNSILNLITEDNEDYVDFSNASVVQSNRLTGSGCLTFIHSGSAIRMKLSAKLLEDIGNPDAVLLKVVNRCLGIFPTTIDAFGADRISKDRLIYNNGRINEIIVLTGVKIRDKG